MKERKIAKKYISVQLGEISPYDFDGTLDKAIELLNEKKRETAEFKDVTIGYTEDCFEIWCKRLETDFERDRRQRAIEKEAEQKRRKLAFHSEYIKQEAKKLGIL